MTNMLPEQGTGPDAPRAPTWMARLWRGLVLGAALAGVASGSAGAERTFAVGEALEVGGAGLESVVAPLGLEFDLGLPVEVSHRVRMGRIVGSRNAVITPAVEVAGRTVVPAVRADTRTGIALDFDARIRTDFDLSGRLGIGRWADGVSVRPELTVPTFYATDFVGLRTRSNIASRDPDFTPSAALKGGLGLAESFATTVSAYALGIGGTVRGQFGFDADLSLFDLEVRPGFAKLGLPTDALPGLDALGADVTPGSAGILKRMQLARDVAGNGLVTIDLLNPLSGNSRYETVQGDGFVGYETDTPVLRAGVDLLALVGRVLGVPTGFSRDLGRGVKVTFQPASVDLQLEAGYGQSATVRPEIPVSLTNVSGGALFYRGEDGAVRTLGPGETLPGLRWDALPEFQASAPATLEARFGNIDLVEQTRHVLKLGPALTLNVPKSFGLTVGGKAPPFLKSRGPLASIGTRKIFDIPLEESTRTVAGLDLPDTTLRFDLVPETPRFAQQRELGLGAGAAGMRDLNLAAAAPPSPSLISCHSVLGGFLFSCTGTLRGEPVSPTLVDRSGRDRLLADAQAARLEESLRRRQIEDERGRLENRFLLDGGGELDVSGFMAADAALRVAAGDRLVIGRVDLDHVFGQVHVESGASLFVGNDDEDPGFFALPGRGVPLVRNDGHIELSAAGGGRSILFSDAVPVRTFTGSGETSIALGADGTLSLNAAPGGVILNDGGHTLGVDGGQASVRVDNGVLTNLGTLSFEATVADIVAPGEAMGEAVLGGKGAPGGTRRTRNLGTVRADRGADVTLHAPYQLENGGEMLALGGARLAVTADGAPGLDLWSEPGTEGRFTAEGAGSRVELLGRVRLRFGAQRFEARDGGTVELAEGIGQHFAAEHPDGGLGHLLAGAGGTLRVGELARLDGSVQVEEGGTLYLNGLSARTERGLVIENAGTLELLSGDHGPIRQPLAGTIVTKSPGEPAPAPDPVGEIRGIDLTNAGTIRIHPTARLAYTADVTDYAFDGVAFTGGTWDLIGTGVGERKAARMLIGLKAIELDPELAAAVSRGVVLPDPATVRITHNRADIRLRGEAALRYRFIESTDALAGDFDGVFAGAHDYLAHLTTNEGRLLLEGHAGAVEGSLRTSGLAPGFGGGVLRLTGGASLTVGGVFTNEAAETWVGSGSTLDAAAYEVRGGTLTVDETSRLAGLEGGVLASGRRIEVGERTELDENGDEIRTLPGVLDLRGRRVREIGGEVRLEGAGARFDALDGVERVRAGGTLALDLGARATGGRELADGTRTGLRNEGSVEVRNGSVLDVLGDYLQALGGATVVERGGMIGADRLVFENGQHFNLDGIARGEVILRGLGALLTGGGDIAGSLELTGGALVNPGNSPGVMDIFGDATFGAGSGLLTEVGGLAPGEFDQLNVFGDLTLEPGALWSLDFTGFTGVPTEGDRINVLNVLHPRDTAGAFLTDAGGDPLGGGIDGWFEDITLLGLDGFRLLYEPGSVLAPRMAIARNADRLNLLLVMNETPDGARFDLLFAVPSPASASLLLLGTACLGLRGRLRGRRTA